MRKFDSLKLLKERAAMFEKHFGSSEAVKEGNVKFSSLSENCSLTYTRKKTLLSANYFLCLKATYPAEQQDKKSSLSLNRLGRWRVTGKSEMLEKLRGLLTQNEALTRQLRNTDLESVVITSEKSSLTLHTNLYGGGFSAVVLPPMKMPVGISEEQIGRGARLFQKLNTEISRAL